MNLCPRCDKHHPKPSSGGRAVQKFRFVSMGDGGVVHDAHCGCGGHKVWDWVTGDGAATCLTCIAMGGEGRPQSWHCDPMWWVACPPRAGHPLILPNGDKIIPERSWALGADGLWTRWDGVTPAFAFSGPAAPSKGYQGGAPVAVYPPDRSCGCRSFDSQCPKESSMNFTSLLNSCANGSPGKVVNSQLLEGAPPP